MVRYLAYRIICVLLLPALLVTAVPAAAQSGDLVTHTFTLQARAAEEVADQVRALYPDAGVTAHRQSLIVRSSRRELEEIATLIQSVDVPPVQLRITLRSQEQSGGRHSGAGLSVSNGDAGATVSRRVIRTGGGQQRSLIVQDGQTAHITSGQIRTLPVVIRGGRNPAALLAQVTTRTGFLVTPRVISGQAVELTIVSFEEDPATPEGYDTEALMTLRQVQPGQWVSLGGISSYDEEQQQGLVYRVNSSRSQTRQVQVRVDILP